VSTVSLSLGPNSDLHFLEETDPSEVESLLEWAKVLVKESQQIQKELVVYVPKDILEEMGYYDHEIQSETFLNKFEDDLEDNVAPI